MYMYLEIQQIYINIISKYIYIFLNEKIIFNIFQFDNKI